MDALDAKYGLHNQDMMTGLDARNTAQRYQCFSLAGLAIGSVSKKTLKIVNTVTYSSNGIGKSKTTAAVAFTATTHDITASASTVQEACYLVTLASDGTPTVTMGTVSTGAGTALLPSVPSGGTPIGFARIAVAAGSTIFDATSDDLDAAHLTVTYYDILGPLSQRFDSAI